MNNNIKVSIIIPVYNVEEYIGRCLDSVVNQTLKEIEIIIVNDGSKDKSKDIALKYKELFPEKILYIEKENGGLSDARNYGMRYARGEYVAFLDSDDYIELSTYEEMYNATLNGEKSIVECDFFWEFVNRKRIDTVSSDYNSINDFLLRGRVVAWNKLYKREWLESKKLLFHKGIIFEDVEFFFSLIPQLDTLEQLGVVHKPFIHYVQREKSILADAGLKTIDICQVYLYAYDYLKKIGKFDVYKEELEYKFIRNVLWGFPLKRVRNIKDKEIKKKVLEGLWKGLNDNISNWKNNKYIKFDSVPNVYLRLINKGIYMFLFVYIL